MSDPHESRPIQPQSADSHAAAVNRHVYVLATLDTKGREAAYVRDLLVSCGASAQLVDVGCSGAPALEIREFDLHINDPGFAQAAAQRLVEMMHAQDVTAAEASPIEE